jgi:hypothetical protein
MPSALAKIFIHAGLTFSSTFFINIWDTRTGKHNNVVPVLLIQLLLLPISLLPSLLTTLLISIIFNKNCYINQFVDFPHSYKSWQVLTDRKRQLERIVDREEKKLAM